MKEARVFIVYHPLITATFNLIADFVRKNCPQVDCVLIRALHPYWKTVKLDRHISSFDLFLPLPDVGYRRNIIAGLIQAWQFRREVRKISEMLQDRYSRIDVYSDNSSYLPVNILLSHFYASGSTDRIYRLARTPQANFSHEPEDRLYSIITAIYCSVLKLFKVLAVRLPAVTSFIYADDNPIGEVIFESPYAPAEPEGSREAGLTLPEPFLLLDRKPDTERDTVVIFGGANILQAFSQYIDDKEEYDKKLRLFFERIKSFYEGCTLLYKPHPADGGRLMSGVDPSEFTVYDEPQTAEMLLIDNLERIKAVYSFFSIASISASLMRIPSYHIFEYFMNAEGIKVLNEHAREGGWYSSPYLKKIKDPGGIGCIDSISIKTEDEESWRERWREFLK